MTVLITGGAGYIGSHMALELVEAGERVVVLDNLSAGYDWAVPPRVPLVVGNSGDRALAKQARAALDDPSPLVRGAAIWALSRLLPEAEFARLGKDRTAREPDATTRAEWLKVK